jgi:predicted NAD/FAD-binding protein
MRIAIVGSGISGLVAAHLLHGRHEVVVYEAQDRIGGHTHTVEVRVDGDDETEGARHAIDTGFIVYNERTYPSFTRLLAELGVETQASDMSFGSSCERTGLEWGSRGLRGVLAQPTNLLRPSFHRMLRDVLRFNRQSRTLLSQGDEKTSLGDYLCGAGYSNEFVDHYVVPLGAAIWSADPAAFLRMTAATFVRLFENHGLLESSPSLPWSVVRGVSARYVEKLVTPFRDQIRVACPVQAVRRRRSGVDVFAADGVGRFDHVVLAVHSDQALRMLSDPSSLEQQLLSRVRYQRNEVVLHTDTSLMPRRKNAWASWNYRVPHESGEKVLVTYDMNRLQRLGAAEPVCVTLNRHADIDPAAVIQRIDYAHPVYDPPSDAARRRRDEISGRNRTSYVGAYWHNGFHEDGVRSAVEACRPLGSRWR